MKTINILFLALNIVAIMIASSNDAKANVTYRMLAPSQMNWKVANKPSDDLMNVCGAYNVFENEFVINIIKSDNASMIRFDLPNLTQANQRVFETQLFFDNSLIFSGALNNIAGTSIDFSLNDSHLNKLYQAKNIDLSVNALGYSFEAQNIFQAQTIINECKVKMAATNNAPKQIDSTERFIAEPPETAFKKLVPKLPVVESVTPNANIMDRLNVNLGKNRVSYPVVDEVKPTINPARPRAQKIPMQANIPVTTTNINKLNSDILSNDSTQQPLVDMLSSKKIEVAKPNINGDVEKPKEGKLFEEQLTSQIPTVEPMQEVVPTIKGPKTEVLLTDDERELFESMKTKMFLLEREKQAVRNELTDIRQKEIEIMKVDIGSRYKIEEQAEKIELLQQKLKQYQYQQVNLRDEKSPDTVSEEELIMDSVPVEEVAVEPLSAPLPPLSVKKPEMPNDGIGEILEKDSVAGKDVPEVESVEIMDVVKKIGEAEQKSAAQKPVNDAQALEAIETEALEALKSIDDVDGTE